MRVLIGFDPREAEAARVAAKTLYAKSRIEAEFLDADRLRDAGLLWRITDYRGQHYDLISNAPKSTTFAVSRFLTPILCQSGWALYCDCDVVFMRNPMEMLDCIEPGKAVYVVKHDYQPSERTKMGGQAQTAYTRKLWSSVMLFDCGHPANRRISLHDINTRPGRDMHRFYWLNDSEIGALDPIWNVLIGINEMPQFPGVLHYTLGGPFIHGWDGGPHDDIWLEAARR